MLITSSKLCQRIGNTFTVQVSGIDAKIGKEIDHSGSVLHQLSNPGETPVFLFGDHRVDVPDLSNFELKRRFVFNPDGTKHCEVVELPEYLKVLDSFIGDTKSRWFYSSTKSKRLLLLKSELGNLIDRRILHVQAEFPGMMGFALGGDRNLGEREIAISLRQAKRFVKKLMRSKDTGSQQVVWRLLTRLPINDIEVAKAVHADLIQGGTPTKEGWNIIREVAKCLDGIAVYCIRYPNASSTSHELKTLRVYLNAPADAVYMRAIDLVRRHQGDCDGDRLGFHISEEDVPEFTKEPSPLRWERSYMEAHTAFSLDDLCISPEKPQVEIMKGFSERGQWVGLLTYNFWLLFFAAAGHYKFLECEGKTFSSPDELCPYVLDLFTPLIEGVMNARKATGAGVSYGESLAKAVCDMFSGRRNIEEVVSLLPVREDHIYDEERFSKGQIDFLKSILKMVAGKGNTLCYLNNNRTGACTDPVLLAFALRWSTDSIEMLLNQIPREADFHYILLQSLLVKGNLPWKNGRPLTRRTMIARPEDFEDNWY